MADALRAGKRRVRFHPDVTVRSTIGFWEMSPQEMKAYWFTDADLQKIQDDTIITVLKMRVPQMQGSGDDNRAMTAAGMCFRGIEHLRDPEALKSREEAKTKTIRAVLARQAKLRAEAKGGGRQGQGEAVPDLAETLAEFSLRSTSKARKLALKIAASDAAFALKQRQSQRDSSSSREHRRSARSASTASSQVLQSISSSEALDRVRDILGQCQVNI